MNLKKFNKENCTSSRGNGGGLFISANRRGVVSLSQDASELMHLEPGSTVAIFQDEDSEEWYIGTDKDGWKLRPTTGKHPILVFNNSVIAKKLLAHLPESIKYARYKLSKEPVMNGKQKLYCILMASFAVPETE